MALFFFTPRLQSFLIQNIHYKIKTPLILVQSSRLLLSRKKVSALWLVEPAKTQTIEVTTLLTLPIERTAYDFMRIYHCKILYQNFKDKHIKSIIDLNRILVRDEKTLFRSNRLPKSKIPFNIFALYITKLMS